MGNGWITKRRMKTGKGIGGYREKGKGAAPLRSIIGIIRPATGMFDQAKVLLECGHEAWSNGQYRARCRKCLHNQEAAF